MPTFRDCHINFRIGVHVGDVMIKGGDLFGDGVNIAARLQTLASAGGTCIPGIAHDQVRKILPFAFSDLGAQQVENIEEPVRAFAVTMKGASPILMSSNASVPLALPDKPSIAVLPFQMQTFRAFRFSVRQGGSLVASPLVATSDRIQKRDVMEKQADGRQPVRHGANSAHRRCSTGAPVNSIFSRICHRQRAIHGAALCAFATR